MAKIPVSFASGLYDRQMSLYTKEIEPEGIDLNYIAMNSVRDIFDRMGASQEFDVAEMSSSEYISHVCGGNSPFVAIPVFPSRVFRHSFITYNLDSGIRAPKDFEGRRIGVPLYTMTAAVWQRGHLQHDYGVDLSTIEWVQGAVNHAGQHGEPSVVPMVRPARVLTDPAGRSLSELIDKGEIDGMIGTAVPHAMKNNPRIQRLFPDYRTVEKNYYKRTGIFPIMHLVVIRKTLYEQHPFIAKSLFDAFNASKHRAVERLRANSLSYMLPWLSTHVQEINEVFGDDYWPYGLEPNRKTLTALVTYMADQGLIAKAPAIDSLFVPVGQ
jgi:4,5-dihydroxyphthalate decarboxylase